jgi:hypothetical protein
MYWFTAGLFGVSLGTYAMFKYKVQDSAYLFSTLTLLMGLPILGLYGLASFITSM